MTYITIPFESSFNRDDFSCDKLALDIYLQKQASQDIKRKRCVCFILPGENKDIKGFYTLSNDSILQKYLPDEIIRKLPKTYINLPVTLLGRLAVNTKFKGQGFGELLLIDALQRSYDVLNESIGSMAVVVDPLDKDAERFYDKYGFIIIPDSGKMFLPMKTISQFFNK